MTEGVDARAATPAGNTAGGLLRQARQAQGMHIGALAAAIKVTQRKLEALEADRLDELPDATFTRALAQTVCRQLKIDAAPVLALLPPQKTHRIEHLGEGINETFRERPDSAAAREWASLSSPAIWGPALVLLAAAAVYLVPPGFLSRLQTAVPPPGGASASVETLVLPAATPPASAAAASVDAAAPVASAVVETVHGAQEVAPSASEPAPVAAVSGVLQLRTSAESWIEVLDARGQALLQRTVLPGETLGLDGAMPLKLKIGNAAVTQLVFRGQALDLAPFTRDNVARLELK